MSHREEARIAFDLKDQFEDDSAAALERAERLLATSVHQTCMGVVMFIEFARPDWEWSRRITERLVEKALAPGSSEADLAGRAILAMALYRDARDVSWIIGLLASPRPLIKQRALQYLCHAPHPSAVQPLRDYLANENNAFADIARSAQDACEGA